MQIQWVSTDTLLDWVKKHGVITRQDRTWEMVHHSTREPLDFALVPTPTPQYLYRGQVQRYSPCLSSISRGVTIPTRILEELPRATALRMTTNMLRADWYCQLLNNHPLLRWAGQQRMYVDRMSIAQHYGIPTGYIDITESLEVALFFATQRFANSVPKPSASGTGILYRLDLSAVPENAWGRFKPIGIQPFMRPFRQWAWTCELFLGENFESCPWLEAVEFAQDEAFGAEVRRIAEQAGTLMPPDFLADLATSVNHSTVLPEDLAKPLAKDLCADPSGFANTSPDRLVEELSEFLATSVPSIELSCSVPEFFSQEILDTLESTWAAEKRGFVGMINRGMEFQMVRTIAGGTIQADAANDTSTFKTDLASSIDNEFEDCVIVFTSGVLKEEARKVTVYSGATKILTASSPFATTPAVGDRFILSKSYGYTRAADVL